MQVGWNLAALVLALTLLAGCVQQANAPTPTPIASAGTLYICNRVLHLEAIEVAGRLTAVVVCAEGEVQ